MDSDSNVIEFPENRVRVCRNHERPTSSEAILTERIAREKELDELNRRMLPDEIQKTIRFLNNVEWGPDGVFKEADGKKLAMYPLNENGHLFMASNGKFYYFRQTILDLIKSLFTQYRGFYYYHWVSYDANEIDYPTEIISALSYIRGY